MPDFEAAGVDVYALSYDEPDALANFAANFGITFPLLSDPDSEVIERFGILNTLVASDDHPWYGIPFPGSYVIDGEGTIVAKYFEHNLAIRPGGEVLIRAALGDVETLAARDEPVEEVTVDVALDGADLPRGVLRELVVRFRVPEGQHLYGEPVPAGMVAATVELDDDQAVVVSGRSAPPTRSMAQASGEELPVYDGDVELRVTLTQNGSRDTRHDDGSRTTTIAGTVRWQACDDEQCGLPAQRRFELEVPAPPALWMGRTRDGVEVDENFQHHFAAMTERRAPST